MQHLSVFLKAIRLCPQEMWVVFLIRLFEHYSFFCVQFTLAIHLIEDHHFSLMKAALYYGIYHSLVLLLELPSYYVFVKLTPKYSMILASTLLLLGRVIITYSVAEVNLIIGLFVLCPLGSALSMPLFVVSLDQYIPSRYRVFVTSLHFVFVNAMALVAGCTIDTLRFWKPDGIDIVSNSGNDPDFTTHLSPYRLSLLYGTVAVALQFFLVLGVMKQFEPAKDTSVKRLKHSITKTFKCFHKKSLWTYMGVLICITGIRTLTCHIDITFPIFATREYGKFFGFGLIQGLGPMFVVLAIGIVGESQTEFNAQFLRIAIGSAISAGAIFLLVIPDPSWLVVVAWLLIMSIGEAFWGPNVRSLAIFLAPHKHISNYSNVSTFFRIFHVMAGAVISGILLQTYLPNQSHNTDPERIWIIIGCICLSTPLFLLMLIQAFRYQHYRRHAAIFVDKTEGKHNNNPTIQKSNDDTYTQQHQQATTPGSSARTRASQSTQASQPTTTQAPQVGKQTGTGQTSFSNNRPQQIGGRGRQQQQQTKQPQHVEDDVSSSTISVSSDDDEDPNLGLLSGR